MRRNRSLLSVDVAIVGGGPAACSSALTLRSRGHAVAIVAEPNTRNKPTETSAPKLKEILRSLNAMAALDTCEPCFGFSTNWGRARVELQPSILNPLGHAWFVHRASFDLRLRELVKNNGATWIDSRAEQIEIDRRGVTIRAVNEEVIHAKWLVIAAGSLGWSARVTRQTPFYSDVLLAFWGFLPARLTERILSVEAVDYGWWYVCPGENGMANACLITDSAIARTLRPRDSQRWRELFFKTALHRSLDEFQMGAPPIYSAVTGLAFLPKRLGPRWIAVGDSAVMLDPLGSSGIVMAIESGMRAGVAVSEELQGRTASSRVYPRWSNSLIEAFTAQREKEYGNELRMRRGEFWVRRANRASGVH